MKKFVAFLLVLTMSLSLFAGCKAEKKGPKTQETTDVTEEVTEPAPRVPLVPELGADEDILTFRYEEKYKDLYYEKLEQYEEAAMDGDLTAVEALREDIDELSDFIYDQTSIAQVLNCCNTKDEEAADRLLEMTNILYDLSDAEMLAMRRIYESDCTIKDEIFADWTEEEIEHMKKYTSEVRDIKKREEEILVELREKEDEEREEILGAYYSELVTNNNRMAEIFGYENFYEYSYQYLRGRDYSAEEVKQLRAFAKEYCYDIYEMAVDRFTKSLEELSYSNQRKLRELITGDYNDTDYLEEYLDALPGEMGDEMNSVFDGYSIFPKGAKAREGAFTTMIGDHPFCYFSRGYKTATTLAHEMGHYYAAFYTDVMELPLDIAEIQSQGNEWLLIAYCAEELNEEVYQCYVDYRIANDMITILISVIIDEFEERVYTTESVEGYELKDFDKIMEEVCKEYGGIKKLSEVVDVQDAWRSVAPEQAVYYISYAVSMVPSLDLFFLADEDWDAAVEVYQMLTTELDEDPTFLKVLKAAGLATPFEDTLFNKFVERYEEPQEEETAEAA